MLAAQQGVERGTVVFRYPECANDCAEPPANYTKCMKHDCTMTLGQPRWERVWLNQPAAETFMASRASQKVA